MGKDWNSPSKSHVESENAQDQILGRNPVPTNGSPDTGLNTSISLDTQVKQTEKIKANTLRDEKKIGFFNNPESRYETPMDKGPLHQFFHKQPLEQTPYYQNKVLTQDNTPIASDKVKANALRDEKKIGYFNNPQSRHEVPIDKGPPNQFSHKQPLEQTQYYHNEVLIRDNTPITSDQ